MIRLSILFLSIFSLIYGIYFLIFPYSFVILTVAENTNIAWLRNLGGAITGLLFIGLLMIYLNTKGSIRLLNVIIITSIIQTSALIYSRISNEFSANNLIIIESTIPVGTTEKIYLFLKNLRKDLNFPSIDYQSDKNKNDVFISHCPERVLPGNIIYELYQNDRIIGGLTKKKFIDG